MCGWRWGVWGLWYPSSMIGSDIGDEGGGMGVEILYWLPLIFDWGRVAVFACAGGSKD